MNHSTRYTRKDDIIKFAVPASLKADIQRLADQRNISLSALMRLILSEYVRNKR